MHSCEGYRFSIEIRLVMLVLFFHFDKKCVDGVDYYLSDVGVYHDVGEVQVVVIHVLYSVYVGLVHENKVAYIW